MTPLVPRVLIIDDDEAIRTMLCKSLEHYGYEARSAALASEGLQLLEHETFDAVMLDIQMPGMNGHAFLRATDRINERPPVIMMSGEAGIDDAIEGFREGIADFLTKPFTLREVAAVVAKVIEQRKRGPAQGSSETIASPPVSLEAPKAPKQEGFVDAVRRELAAGRIRLPIPPSLIEEVMAMGDRTDLDTAHVVRLLEKLPQGAARVLQLMKTPTYGTQGTRKGGLAEAVQHLGIPMAISSALTAALKDSFAIADPQLADTARKMWENSVVTAGLMRIMSIRTRDIRPEAAYLIGLFHNIGEQLYLRICAEKQGAGKPPMEALAQEIIDHHAELGHLMAKAWNLDSLTCEICQRHHDRAYFESDGARGKNARIAALAVLANHLAIQINGSYLPAHPSFPDQEMCRTIVGISVHDLKALVEDGKQTVHDLRTSLV